jgi:hypothetical protein
MWCFTCVAVSEEKLSLLTSPFLFASPASLAMPMSTCIFYRVFVASLDWSDANQLHTLDQSNSN